MQASTTAQKQLKGTAQPCRTTFDLDGKPVGEAQPPKGFTARQKRLWEDLFVLLDESDVITHLDIPALNALALAYEHVLHGEPRPTEIKIFLQLLGKFGLVPSDRGKVSTVRKREASQLDRLRAKRAASGG